MSTANQVTEPALRRLADVHTEGPAVLSVYLNLDPLGGIALLLRF